MRTCEWDAAWTANYTGVGSDAAAGRLLRRYWHPVLLSSEVQPRTLRKIELLGDHLVVFRLADNQLGVLPEHCRHRGASLAYGFIEPDGIRCGYHGWKFSCVGETLETPFGGQAFEGENRRIDWAGRAYECGGVVFVCLNPDPADPVNPSWDLLLSGADEIVVQRHLVDCNWFQYQENAADITHTVFLHGARLRSLGIPDASGFYAQFVWYGFREVPFGLVKAWLYEGRRVGWGNLAVFPNILRIVQEMHWRVPLNAERTLIFQISGRQLAGGPRERLSGRAASGPPLPALSIEDPVIYTDQHAGEEQYRLWSFQGQDAAACATQGRTARRDREHLGASDFGLVMYRRAWQALCDSGFGPATSYSSLKDEAGALDLRPWLSDTDVTVSRPIDKSIKWSSKSWGNIFNNSLTMIPVPRGSAGRGPLG